MKVLFIDNFDLFTYNLVDEFEKQDCEVVVYRNDVDMKIIENVVKKFKPKLIVISSGCGNTGNAVDVIRSYYGKIPIFGVGLGHQCIIEAFEGSVDRSAVMVHGRSVKVTHDSQTIFNRMQNTFLAGRYDSLSAIDVPYSLEVSARDEHNVVMAIRHKEAFVEGIQFHPESLLTPSGSLLIGNVIREAGKK